MIFHAMNVSSLHSNSFYFVFVISNYTQENITWKDSKVFWFPVAKNPKIAHFSCMNSLDKSGFATSQLSRVKMPMSRSPLINAPLINKVKVRAANTEVNFETRLGRMMSKFLNSCKKCILKTWQKTDLEHNLKLSKKLT